MSTPHRRRFPNKTRKEKLAWLCTNFLQPLGLPRLTKFTLCTTQLNLRTTPYRWMASDGLEVPNLTTRELMTNKHWPTIHDRLERGTLYPVLRSDVSPKPENQDPPMAVRAPTPKTATALTAPTTATATTTSPSTDPLAHQVLALMAQHVSQHNDRMAHDINKLITTYIQRYKDQQKDLLDSLNQAIPKPT